MLYKLLLSLCLLLVVLTGCKSGETTKVKVNYEFNFIDKSKPYTKQEYIDYQYARGAEMTFFDFRTASAVFDREPFQKYSNSSKESIESFRTINDIYNVYFAKTDNNHFLKEVSKASFTSEYINGESQYYLTRITTKYYYEDPFDFSKPIKEFNYEEFNAIYEKLNDTLRKKTEEKPTYCNVKDYPYFYNYDDDLNVIPVKTEKEVYGICNFYLGYTAKVAYSIYSDFREEQKNAPVKKERLAIYFEQSARRPN